MELNLCNRSSWNLGAASWHVFILRFNFWRLCLRDFACYKPQIISLFFNWSKLCNPFLFVFVRVSSALSLAGKTDPLRFPLGYDYLQQLQFDEFLMISSKFILFFFSILEYNPFVLDCFSLRCFWVIKYIHGMYVLQILFIIHLVSVVHYFCVPVLYYKVIICHFLLNPAQSVQFRPLKSFAPMTRSAS